MGTEAGGLGDSPGREGLSTWNAGSNKDFEVFIDRQSCKVVVARPLHIEQFLARTESAHMK